ncbi:hypothetical protein [Pseudomonas sp. NUPR-001]|uniref:hypothetical protein n=1 Tax=Pseudomonas sp. NUPR-001 TaxID=3416058 RepID=UPI003F945E56
MKILPWTLLGLGLLNSHAQADCYCLSYPFEPAPPCYMECTKNIVDNNGKDVDKIQNLPTGVRSNLQILIERKQSAQAINFNAITNEYNLGKVASKVQRQESLEIQKPTGTQFDRQRTQQIYRAPTGPAEGM